MTIVIINDDIDKDYGNDRIQMLMTITIIYRFSQA